MSIDFAALAAQIGSHHAHELPGAHEEGTRIWTGPQIVRDAKPFDAAIAGAREALGTLIGTQTYDSFSAVSPLREALIDFRDTADGVSRGIGRSASRARPRLVKLPDDGSVAVVPLTRTAGLRLARSAADAVDALQDAATSLSLAAAERGHSHTAAALCAHAREANRDARAAIASPLSFSAGELMPDEYLLALFLLPPPRRYGSDRYVRALIEQRGIAEGAAGAPNGDRRHSETEELALAFQGFRSPSATRHVSDQRTSSSGLREVGRRAGLDGIFDAIPKCDLFTYSPFEGRRLPPRLMEIVRADHDYWLPDS